VAFEQDAAGDWIAHLGCGHRQHVRHRPPFWNVAWVVTVEGRAAAIGRDLECRACDADP
jgi:hypothetical protein